ncbi:MAG: sensor histidine kinase [Solirubrobacteraceae bacterium]
MNNGTAVQTRAEPAAQSNAHSQAADRRLAVRGLALLRVLLLPIVFAGDRLVDHPMVGTVNFDIVLGVATVYSALMLRDSWRPRGPRAATGAMIVCDLVLVGALAYESGGAFSELRAAFLALPLGAALLLAPRRTVAISLATVATYLVVAIIHPATRAEPISATIAHGLYVLWIGIAAVVLATLLDERRERITALSTARGRLVAQAVAAEERTRRQVADALHDHAIQNLLTARQDLVDARAGDPGASERAEVALQLALDQLRNVVRELHPLLLDRLDLPHALETIADQQARRGGYQVRVETDPRAVGTHDELIAALAREFLANAATHADASRVTLQLAYHDDAIVLDVADDGCGFTPDQQAGALRDGHIGLASSRERVEACAGTLTVTSHSGEGTRIRCAIPVGSTSRGDRI